MSRELDATWLIADAARYPDGARVDVHVRAGRIAAVVPAGDRPGSVAGARPEQHIDARGGLLLPGLHDHHLHLFALAAARASIDLSAASLRAAGGLGAALAAAQVEQIVQVEHAGAWLRGVGYHEQSDGALDRSRLDAL
ncbi:MAG: amidohydrolase family protein, partial [Gammaproteobacteria bacterium]